MNKNSRGAATGDEQEVLKKAMENPEIREILTDPVMRQILKQMEQDPKAASEHLKNPAIASKVRKLMSAGIIRTA
jgi:stress-induced-phosphoprotein 1